MGSQFKILSSPFVSRWSVLTLAIVLASLSFYCVSDLMRESDQASILTGALDLAWGGDILGNDSYRYDKFYGTYWVLAVWYELLGFEVGVEPSEVVFWGNVLATLWYSVTLASVLAFVKCRCCTFWVVFVALISPVLLFSSISVSPNVFSVGCLFLLLGCFRFSVAKQDHWISLGTIFISTLVAVACRADAVLVLPAFCVLSHQGRLKRLFLKKRHWAALFGAVSALLIGRWVGGAHGSGIGETFFFQIKIAAAYLSFGLGVSIFILLILFGYLLLQKRWISAVSGLLLLVPLLFYLGLLFTPRHLILVPIVLLASAVLPRGRVCWHRIVRWRLGRMTLYGATGVSLAVLFIGLKLPKLQSPSLSVISSSLYPTADGYWPMGGSLPFLWRMRSANEVPIDHNQEVWASWQDHDFSKKKLIVWDGLYRYPELVAKCQGHDVEFTKELSSGIMSERLIRRSGGGGGTEHLRNQFLNRQGKVNTAKPSIIGNSTLSLLNLDDLSEGTLEVKARYLAAELCEGNDFLWCPLTDSLLEDKLAYLGDGKCFLISIKQIEGLKGGVARQNFWVYSSRDWEKVTKKEGVFLACVRLPSYMHVKKYE